MERLKALHIVGLSLEMFPSSSAQRAYLRRRVAPLRQQPHAEALKMSQPRVGQELIVLSRYFVVYLEEMVPALFLHLEILAHATERRVSGLLEQELDLLHDAIQGFAESARRVGYFLVPTYIRRVGMQPSPGTERYPVNLHHFDAATRPQHSATMSIHVLGEQLRLRLCAPDTKFEHSPPYPFQQPRPIRYAPRQQRTTHQIYTLRGNIPFRALEIHTREEVAVRQLVEVNINVGRADVKADDVDVRTLAREVDGPVTESGAQVQYALAPAWVWGEIYLVEGVEGVEARLVEVLGAASFFLSYADSGLRVDRVDARELVKD